MHAEKSLVREYLEALLIAVIFATFARTWVVQAFKIPSGSMEKNLLIGDHILVNKFIYGPTISTLEEKLDEVAMGDLTWKQLLRDFWKDFSVAIGEAKDLKVSQVITDLDEILGPQIFTQSEDGVDPRKCPSCGNAVKEGLRRVMVGPPQRNMKLRVLLFVGFGILAIILFALANAMQ